VPKGVPSALERLAGSLRFGSITDGASRTRTGDLLGAIQALSQLSYSPAAADCTGLPTLLRRGLRRRPRSLRVRCDEMRRVLWNRHARSLAHRGGDGLVTRQEMRLVLRVRDSGSADQDPEDEDPEGGGDACPERVATTTCFLWRLSGGRRSRSGDDGRSPAGLWCRPRKRGSCARTELGVDEDELRTDRLERHRGTDSG
jgi:hypothetical protein